MKKKFIVYFCIWIVVTIPTLSYAWLPLANAAATVITATKAGQVLISKGGRVVKYAVPAEKLKKAAIAVYGFCMNYSAFTGDTCGEYGKRVYDILTKDGWQTEQNGNGIEIYKQNSSAFLVYCHGNLDYPSPSCKRDYHDLESHIVTRYTKIYGFNYKYIDFTNAYKRSHSARQCIGRKNNKYPIDNFFVKVKVDGNYNSIDAGISVYCVFDNDKKYLTSDDIWDMIQDPSNGFNDQDITNILKYDYSDKSVTINNHTYNGGDIKLSFDPNININRDGDGTDGKPGWGLEIAPEFAPKIVPIIVNPNIKIGLPDINYNNCTANAQGAIVNCDKLERKYNIDIDGDGKIGNEDPTCPDGYTLKDDKCVKVDPKPPSDDPKDPKDPKPPATKDPQPPAEQKPWVCSTSSLTQKICGWIDWTKEEPAIPADDPIIPIDKTKDIELDKNILTFNKSCPAPQSFSFNMLGKTHSNQFDFKPFCDVATAIKPIILAVGGLVSIYILTGTPRPSDD